MRSALQGVRVLDLGIILAIPSCGRTLAEFGRLIRHVGEEYALVVEGAVEFNCELYTPVVLQTGDAIYFDSSMGHAYLAAAAGRCRVLSICSSVTPAGTAPTLQPELRIVRAQAGSDG